MFFFNRLKICLHSSCVVAEESSVQYAVVDTSAMATSVCQFLLCQKA